MTTGIRSQTRPSPSIPSNRKRARDEVSMLFNIRKKKGVKIVWKHKFVCLASINQEKMRVGKRTTSGWIGEKIIEFENVNISQMEFKSLVIHTYPKLAECGGFHLRKWCTFCLSLITNIWIS